MVLLYSQCMSLTVTALRLVSGSLSKTAYGTLLNKFGLHPYHSISRKYIVQLGVSKANKKQKLMNLNSS